MAGERRNVVQVERVLAGERPFDVDVDPLPRAGEVVAEVGVGQRRLSLDGRAGRELLRGQVQLGRAERHVVAPFGLGVVGVGHARQQRRAGVGVGLVVDRLTVEQAARRVGGVAACEHLGAQTERGGDAAGEVGADRSPRSVRREHGPVDREPCRRPGLGAACVVGLGQTPEIVVAEDAGVVAVADADLEVEDAPALIPHLQQPVGPVARLGEQRSPIGDAGGVFAGCVEQRDVGEARGLDELQVVARVKPAARGVDVFAGRDERSEQRGAAIARHAVDARGGVAQMRGPAVHRA